MFRTTSSGRDRIVGWVVASRVERRRVSVAATASQASIENEMWQGYEGKRARRSPTEKGKAKGMKKDEEVRVRRREDWRSYIVEWVRSRRRYSSEMKNYPQRGSAKPEWVTLNRMRGPPNRKRETAAPMQNEIMLTEFLIIFL
jgi:hypothetical protein